MWCRDPLLDALKAYGYNVVRLPRASIASLQILTRTKADLDRLGDLATIMTPGPTLPAIRTGAAASVAGGIARTGDVAASLGVPMLGNIIAAMGGSTLGLEASYSGAGSLTFEFPDVTEAGVEVASPDQYLGRAKPSPDNREVARLLEADAVHVVTAVLYGSKINVAAKSTTGAAFKVDVGSLARAVGSDGKLSVSEGGQGSSTVQYAGSEPLAFRFQAVRLVFQGGAYEGFRRLETGAAAMREVDGPGRDEAPISALLGGDDTPFVQFRADVDRGIAPARIGIDRSPNFGPPRQWNGCVADVTLMNATLRERFGFAESDLVVLTNEGATRQAILDAMDSLVRRAGPESVVFIQDSGHGSQVTDREGDEADGLDETIVPTDSGRGESPNRDITDDEIFARPHALTAKTANVTLFFDCRHSGTIARDPSGSAGRSVEPDLRPASELAPASIPPGSLAALKATRATRGVGVRPTIRPTNGGAVLLAGCRDEETSFEHGDEAGDGDGSGTRGAMTYFFHQEIFKAGPGTTYDAVSGLTSRAVVAPGLDPATLPAGTLASEASRDYGALRLAVEVVDLGVGQGPAAGRIAGSRLSRMAVPGTNSDARVYLPPAGPPEARGGTLPALGVLDRPTWAAVGRDGLPLAPSGPAADLDRPVDDPETVARYRNRLALANPDPADPLRGEVDLILPRQGPDGSRAPAEADPDGPIRSRDGNPIALRIVNKTGRPIDATVLDLGLTRRIFPVYPPDASHPARAVETYDFGVRPGEEVVLGMPDGFDRPGGDEVFKLIATTTPADIGWMRQDAVRGGLDPANRSPLELLLGSAARPARDAGRPVVPISEPWTTVERPFVLTR